MPTKTWASGASGVSAADLSAHAADTTSVHGITDTAQIALKNASNTFTLQQLFPDGSAASPAIANDGDTNTGILFPNADQIGHSAGGTQRQLLTTALLSTTVPMGSSNGSVTAPGQTFAGDLNTGWYRSAADVMRGTAGGTAGLQLNLYNVQTLLPLVPQAGFAFDTTLVTGPTTFTIVAGADAPVFLCDTTGGAITLELPDCGVLDSGFLLYVVDMYGNAATNNITLDADTLNPTLGTVNGATTKVLATNYGVTTILSSLNDFSWTAGTCN